MGLLKCINDEVLVYRKENRGQISRVALGIMKGRYIDIYNLTVKNVRCNPC